MDRLPAMRHHVSTQPRRGANGLGGALGRGSHRFSPRVRLLRMISREDMSNCEALFSSFMAARVDSITSCYECRSPRTLQQQLCRDCADVYLSWGPEPVELGIRCKPA